MRTQPIIPEDWATAAICNQTDPDLFFPEQGDTAKLAKNICARCPFTDECLQFAMDFEGWGTSTYGRSGIYGGLTPKERANLAQGVMAS